MATQTLDQLVNGGAASAAPPLGPALGPMGVNIGEVIKTINEKTAAFKGMQVPIKLTVDTDTKEFEVEVGTPPATALIKKEAGIQTASGSPLKEKVADLKIPQIIKIAKMKEDDLLGKTMKDRVNEIIGTCVSMGILVEGIEAKDAIKLVKEGKFDKEIAEEKTELSADEMKELEEEKKKLAAEMKERHAEWTQKSQAVIEELKGKGNSAIKKRLEELEIPEEIWKDLLPKEEAKKEA